VSSHFEYLENLSRGLDVTWHPVRGYLTVHPWTVSRLWDADDWAFLLCERRNHNDRASRSASSQQCACLVYSSRAGFLSLQSITSPRPVSPHSPDLASCDFWLFPKLKLSLKGRRFVNVTVTQYTNSVNGLTFWVLKAWVLTQAVYRQATTNSRREWQYHSLHVYNFFLLKMSTWGTKHVQE